MSFGPRAGQNRSAKSKSIVALNKRPNYTLDIVIFIVIAFLCYISFQHGDIVHTGSSSYSYLNGKILDFYDYNRSIFSGNNYLPSTYILYAVWNLPFWLVGMMRSVTWDWGPIIYWFKLLPIVFFFATALFVYRIGLLLSLSQMNARVLTMVWISSPIAIYSVFIFGQYDAFTIFFTVAGLYYFLKRDMTKFALLFGISFTFKYFGIFLFVPLLLFAEKRFLKIAVLTAIASLPLIIEIAPYIFSHSFREGVFGFGAAERIVSASFTIFPGTSNGVFLVLWIIGCGFIFFQPIVATVKHFQQWTLYIAMTAAVLLFVLLHWHPQWLLFITPFLAITTFMEKDRIKWLAIADLLLMAVFVGVTVCFFQMNADQHLFNLGVWGKVNPKLLDANTAYPMARIFGTRNLSAYHTVFISILLMHVIVKFPRLASEWNGDGSTLPTIKYWNFIRLRFYAGVAIFIVPAVVAYIITFYA